MSDYKVPYTTILNITPHSGADRLEMAWVYGFQVVVQKGRYKVGDAVVYIPIDSILPSKLDAKLFPPESKIKLHHHRVRQIRIRGLASQGMLVDPAEIEEFFPNIYYQLKLEEDLSSVLNITKYEPPVINPPQVQGARKLRNKKTDNPLFHKYNGLDNIKWFPDLFQLGEEVVVQEKLHGTNARAGIVPFEASTLWKKFLKFIRLAPEWENCYGSNNVEISAASSYRGFYGEDVYGATFKRMKIFEKLKPGEIVYGEIIGPSIQKNYDYSLKEHKFVVFDIKKLQSDGKYKWLDPIEVKAFCMIRDLEYVPVVYEGAFEKEYVYSLTKGSSLYDPNQKVREGIVIKAIQNYSIEGNKKALKWVSEEYLADYSNTDNH